MNYYSFNRPRRNSWLSWPCWLTDSGRFTHKVVTRPAVSLAQDRESSPARTGGLTTMLRHQEQCEGRKAKSCHGISDGFGNKDCILKEKGRFTTGSCEKNRLDEDKGRKCMAEVFNPFKICRQCTTSHDGTKLLCEQYHSLCTAHVCQTLALCFRQTGFEHF